MPWSGSKDSPARKAFPMRFFTSFAIAMSLVAPAACTSSTNEDSNSGDQGSEQDLTAAKTQLKGSWTISDASKALTSEVAYEFRPNGQFFRDGNRVLNGIFLPGAAPPVSRQSGTYTVNTVKHQITLHVTSSLEVTEVVNFEYTPGQVLNG